MKRQFLTAFFALWISMPVNAAEMTFNVDYASPEDKGPSLENAQMRGQIFVNGDPMGFFDVVTDANKQFTLDINYTDLIALEVYSVQGQDELKMRCFGNSLEGSKKVIILCEPK